MQMSNHMNIGIIGAGASGLICASTIIEDSNLNVTIFDSNKTLGVKLALTGGGRCNITNYEKDVKKFLQNYPRGSKFILPAIKSFTPVDTIKWFESHDLKTKIESDNRVFPKSDRSMDVINVFRKILNKKGTVLLNNKVNDVKHFNNTFVVEVEGKKYTFDILVISTGGMSFSETGSTGDGYKWARSLNHTVTKLGQSLTSLTIDDPELLKFQGMTFEHAQLIFEKENIKSKYKGSLLITGTGISGPAVFKLSSALAFNEINKNNPVKVWLNTNEINSKQALSILSENRKNNVIVKIKTLLKGLYYDRYIKYLLIKSEINEDENLNSIDKSKFRTLCLLIQNGIELNITGRSKSGEFVTAGGIDTTEINSKTLESKIIKNLYFIGEILNYDGYTGGYNLQGAWSTGRLVAKSIIESIEN